MGFTEGSTPVTSSDGDNGELGKDDGAADSSCDFLGALDAETDMTVEVSNGDERLEPGTLTSTGLLLYRHDLHDLILELGQEEIDNLEFLDGEREKVDLLHGFDLAVLYETAQLGDGNPWNACLVTEDSHETIAAYHSFSSSLRPPRRGPRRPLPLSPPRPRPNPPRPRGAASAIVVLGRERLEKCKNSSQYLISHEVALAVICNHCEPSIAQDSDQVL